MLKGFGLSMLICSVYFGVHVCEKDKVQSGNQKDIIVVGGGLAGMGAARELLKTGNYNVKVFEARRTRYGGRIWTKRSIGENIKGAEAELGGMFLNTRLKDNPLLKLIKKFDLRTKNAGSLQVHFPEQNLVYFGDNATSLYTEAFKILSLAKSRVKKQGRDISVTDAVANELENSNTSLSDKDPVYQIAKTLPFPQVHNVSTLLYDPEMDFGWDSIVVDGLDTLIDRIVAGEGMDKPIKVQLNKVARNIKVDPKRNKVLVRTMDRKQAEADGVIIAVPLGVLKKKDIIFEPPLSRNWYKSIAELDIYTTNKVIVGFEKAFWPTDVGSFSVFSDIAANGFLQMWTNMYRITGTPHLIGYIFGETAVSFEKMTDKELKLKVTIILTEMFGEEKLRNNKIKLISRSKWTENKYTLGTSAYPKVGSEVNLWKILQKPLCPFIYFAGAYTETRSYFETLHGAYNSGIRAANQIINNVCVNKKDKESNKKSASKKSRDEL